MKNIMKILFVIFTFVTVPTLASAGELSVTGGANFRYQIMSSDSAAAGNNLDKGMGVTNEFTLSASGELDNGYAWNYALDLDPTAGTGAVIYDDAQLTLATDYGTIGAFIHEGSLGTKYAWDTSAYGVASDTGNGFGMIYAGNISSYDNIQYHLPSGMLPLGGTFKVAYSPNGQAGYSSGGTATLNTGATAYDITQYQVTMAPFDGLSVKADYMELDSTDADQTEENGSWGIKYAAPGGISVGYGRSYKAAGIASLTDAYSAAKDTALAGYESIENKSMGVGFSVNDNLSVSYTEEESTPNAMTSATSTYAMTITSIQAAYTMGGMTLSLSQDDAENSDYVQNSDEKEFLMAISMAF